MTLHGERVQVERHPVNRPATAADMDGFQEKTIAATARTEEAVIGKDVRIVEEIGLRKEAADRTETVRDTVRKTEVDVEDLSTMAHPTGVRGAAGTAGAGVAGAASSVAGAKGCSSSRGPHAEHQRQRRQPGRERTGRHAGQPEGHHGQPGGGQDARHQHQRRQPGPQISRDKAANKSG